MRNISDRFYTLLGLCHKAGALVSGSTASIKAIRNGKAKLVILSRESSDGTYKQFTNLCNYYKIKMIIGGSKSEMGRAIGKPERTVIVIIDENFKILLLKNMEKTNTGVISEWQK